MVRAAVAVERSRARARRKFERFGRRIVRIAAGYAMYIEVEAGKSDIIS